MDEIVIPFYLEPQTEVGVRITSEAFSSLVVFGKTHIEAVENALAQARALLEEYCACGEKDIPEDFLLFLHDEMNVYPSRLAPHLFIEKTGTDKYEVRCPELPEFSLRESSIAAAVEMSCELVSNIIVSKGNLRIRFDGKNPMRHDGRFLFYAPLDSDITAKVGRMDFICQTKWARFAYQTSFIPLFGIVFFIPLAFVTLYDISTRPHWGYHYLGKGALFCFLLSVLPICLLILLWYFEKV